MGQKIGLTIVYEILSEMVSQIHVLNSNIDFIFLFNFIELNYDQLSTYSLNEISWIVQKGQLNRPYSTVLTGLFFISWYLWFSVFFIPVGGTRDSADYRILDEETTCHLSLRYLLTDLEICPPCPPICPAPPVTSTVEGMLCELLKKEW